MSVPPPTLPVGTVTFLRTDVEGSMRLARELGSAWDELNAIQLEIIRSTVAEHGGVRVRTEGDAMFAAFPEAPAAARAAIACQRRIGGHPWPSQAPVRVRIGLHTGQAHLAGDDYGGFDVNRAARVAAVGHGGQIVLSDPTRALIAADLPAGAAIRDLGRHLLRDVPNPEHLFQLDGADLPSSFPPLRTGAAASGNLPPRLTSLIGREQELRELGGLLERTRLLTVTGPGGIGKTSLAVELARAHAAAFEDGAWFVPLDAVLEPHLVATGIARTLGLYDGPGRPAGEGLARHLEQRACLLVLDNFEHLLDAAPEVTALLRKAPRVRVVVTSRAPLRVAGEQEYPLASLDVRAPDELAGREVGGSSDAAFRLFEERAAAVRPGWQAGPDAPIVREICALLDGLPLGIELAAARISVLPAVAIRDRLAARLPLPGAGPRDLPDRQRTLDGAITWSYDLLDERQRGLLREMAVFDGGFDLDQAREVAAERAHGADTLDGLVELADHSLVGRDRLPEDGSRLGGMRFRLLETIRSFALRRLADDGGEPAVRLRHARAFLALAETAARHLPGPEQVRWLDRLAEDHANLRSAVLWSVEAGEIHLAQRLAAALWRYWQLGGHLREGRALIDAVIDMPGADEPTRERLWALGAAGGIAYWQGEARRADLLYRNQYDVARRVGDPAGEADALFNLSSTAFVAGETAEARRSLEAARALYTQLNDERGVARTEWGDANLDFNEGRVEEAVAAMIDGRDRYVALGDGMYAALTSSALAWGFLFLGNRREALRRGVEGLAEFHALRDVATSTITLAGGAIAMIEFDRFEEAATLMGAFEALCEVHGVRPPAGLDLMIQSSVRVQTAMDTLRSDAHRDAVQRGRQMSLDEAVAFVIERAAEILGSEEAA